eukprot:18157-Heterococcus_DN1.PRE.2
MRLRRQHVRQQHTARACSATSPRRPTTSLTPTMALAPSTTATRSGRTLMLSSASSRQPASCKLHQLVDNLVTSYYAASTAVIGV